MKESKVKAIEATINKIYSFLNGKNKYEIFNCALYEVIDG